MNKIPRLATGVAVAIALLGALGLGYWWGHSRSADGMTEVVSGLRGGEKVVVSGQFLIDSEASLSGVLERQGTGDKAESPGRQP